MNVRIAVAGQTVPLERGQVEIELIMLTGGSVRLATIDPSTGSPVPSVALGDAVLALSDVDIPIDLAVQSVHGAIPDDTTAKLSVLVRAGGHESRVIGPVTELGALTRVTVAELRPSTAGIDLTMRRVDGVGGEDELTEVARAAQFASRRLLESGTVSTAEDGLVLCLDSSASMRAHVASGLLQVLCEVVMGMDRGLGDGGDVPVFAVGQQVSPLDPLTPAVLAAYAEKFAASTHPTTGMRWARLPDQPGIKAGPGTICVVTDQEPADTGRLIGELQRRLPSKRWCVSVIDSLGRSARGDSPGLIGYIDPELDSDTLLRESGHEAILNSLVLALVGGSSMDGSR